MSRSVLEFRHVDVFAERPFRGNGLIVVFGGTDLADEELLRVTQELRQFESIFLDLGEDREDTAARIFTAEEELPFAGHPVIGAAAAAHERAGPTQPERSWTLVIAGREVEARSRRHGSYFAAEMNQGKAELSRPLDPTASPDFAAAIGLGPGDLRELPLQVVSTGLPYLIVPVTAGGLERARIAVDDLEQRLDGVGAKFVYVFDPTGREGRTWNNSGSIEDVATGSAAGPAAAYLIEHRLAAGEEEILLEQGRFLARPSTMSVRPTADMELWVGGPVAPVAAGTLDAPGLTGRH